ncbi:hypothetical protein [Gimibacter soli]|uniref:Lipoprotein n=1 Tax=Gimibacter soli TaxID=3024400 RepID=A0AAE9XU74_9PROT|nr:hypothetical protein [Gimibacter soli]WCL55041.1 hypothetical protein PH603_04615 [Gimibacter soli]
MKLAHALILPAIGLALGGCVINAGDGHDYRRDWKSERYPGGYMTVTLKNGDTETFGCQKDMEPYVLKNSDGTADAYGCKPLNAPSPN